MKSIRYLLGTLAFFVFYDVVAEVVEPVHIFQEGGSGILVGDKVVDRMEFTEDQLKAIRDGSMSLDEQVSVLQGLQQNPELNLQDVALIKNGSGMPIDQQISLLQQSNAGTFNADSTVVTSVVDPLAQPSDGTFDPRDFQAAVDTDVAAVDTINDDQKSSSVLSSENAAKMIKDATRLQDDLTEVDQHMAELQNQTWIEKVKSAFVKAKNAITNFVKSVIGSGKADEVVDAVRTVDARLKSGDDDDSALLALFSDDGDVAAVSQDIAGSLEFLDDDIAQERDDSTIDPNALEALEDERYAAADKADEYVQAVSALERTIQQSSPSDARMAVAQKLDLQTTTLKKELADALIKEFKTPQANAIANSRKVLNDLTQKLDLTPWDRSQIVTLERETMRVQTAVNALKAVQRLSSITPEQQAAVQAFGNKVVTIADFKNNFGEEAFYKMGIELTGSDGGRAKSSAVARYSNLTDPGSFYRQLSMSTEGSALFRTITNSQDNFVALPKDQITQVGEAFMDYAAKFIGDGKPFKDLPRHVQQMYLKSIGNGSPDAVVANLLEPLVQRAETHSLLPDIFNGKAVSSLPEGVMQEVNAAQKALVG